MFQPRSIIPEPTPHATFSDYTPVGPWTNGQVVVRNIDGVGFVYSASLNALTGDSNKSHITKDANNFPIINLSTPTNANDAASKTYVDSHVGGIPEAPTTGSIYGRGGTTPAWVLVLPLTGGTLTGPLILNAAPSAPLGAANKGYVDTAVSGVVVPAPSGTVPGMDGTGAAGVATVYARGDHIHPLDTSRAPLASPALTGVPTAPTPATPDNSTTIPTTAFVKAQGYLTGNQTVTFTGDITGSGTTSVATTLATVNANVGMFQGITVNGKGLVTGAVNMSYAPLASPALTGVPTAPTPLTADNSTTVSTTAFVKAQGYQVGNQTITLSGDVSGAGATAIATTLATVNANVGTFQGITVNGKGLVTAATNIVGTANPLMNGAVAVGTSLLYARQDHVHPSDTTKLSDAPSDGNYYSRRNAVWAVPPGGGNVTGPGSSVDRDIAMFSGTGGTLLADSSLNWSSGGILSPVTLLQGPTGKTARIKGVTDASDATAGDVGEYVSATGSVALISATNSNPTFNVPSAGDWDLEVDFYITGGGSTIMTNFVLGLSTTADTFPVTAGQRFFYRNAAAGNVADPGIAGRLFARVLISAAQLWYLTCQATFTGTAVTINYQFHVRRRR